MAQIKLDDLLVKKKEAPQVLDLSKSVVATKEDFKKLLDRVPEYKIRPEKVRLEEIKIKVKDQTFKPQKKETQHQPEYVYANPIPPDMRSVALEDFSSVAIDWKMLTSVRPRLKLEEQMFTRLVTMGKLHLSTVLKEKKAVPTNEVKKSKNRAGILEVRVEMCGECGEEFCTGVSCAEFLYDSFVRLDDFTGHGADSSMNGNEALPNAKTRKNKKKKIKSNRKRKRGKQIMSKKKSEKGKKAEKIVKKKNEKHEKV